MTSTVFWVIEHGPGCHTSVRLRPRSVGRQLPERRHRAAPAGEEPDLAELAVRMLFAADPLVRQHPARQLPVVARPVPELWRDLLGRLLPRRVGDGAGV